MPLETLASLVEENRGGVFFLPTHLESSALQAIARRGGFAYYHIEGRNIAKKEQLLNHVATVMRFPGDFGHNWDALEECLTDMEWADGKGYLVYFDHIDGLAAAHPDQLETFIEICRDAVTSWKEDATAMIVLLSGTRAPKGVGKLKETAPD